MCVCQTAYPEELPVILTREHLTEHMKRYAAHFNLNILHSSAAEGSSFNKITQTWTVRIRTPTGPKTVTAKHLVQATGIGGNEPYVPEIPGAELYTGVNIHSVGYKNPRTLSDKGAKVRGKKLAQSMNKDVLTFLSQPPVGPHHRLGELGL